MQSWKGHLSAVSYVSFVERANGVFVVSSSSDSVKLWSADGSHVGTFGQVSGKSRDVCLCHDLHTMSV